LASNHDCDDRKSTGEEQVVEAVIIVQDIWALCFDGVFVCLSTLYFIIRLAHMLVSRNASVSCRFVSFCFVSFRFFSFLFWARLVS
jgi:hypothetical protein